MMNQETAEIMLFTMYPLITIIRKYQEYSCMGLLYYEGRCVENKRLITIVYIALNLCIAIMNLFNMHTGLEIINIKYTVIVSTICWIYLRMSKLYNSIEDIYEGMLIYILLGFACTNNESTIQVGSLLVLITSISAGVQKLSSKMWTGKEGNGFIKFCLLPSVSRKRVRKTVEIFANKKSILNMLKVITIVTPYIQILSAVFILCSVLTQNVQLFMIGMVAQFTFVISLFLIADLSWITTYYFLMLCLICATFESANLEYIYRTNYVSNTGNILMSIYVLMSTYFLFSKKVNKKMKIIRWLCLNIVPFKMFTEVHSENILTHYFEGMNEGKKANTKLQKVNAFQQNGQRAQSQTMNSRLKQSLMYPIGDYLMNDYNDKEPFNSIVHQQQIEKILKMKDLNKIIIFQHIWNNKMHKYMTILVATASRSENFKPKYHSKINPQKR